MPAYVFTGGIDGLGVDAEFRITINAQTGTPTLSRDKVEWQEETGSGSSVTYPSAVCLFEQRLVFANFTHDGQLIRASQTGDYRGWDRSRPSQDDDSLDLALAALRLDEIRGLAPLGALIVPTASSIWVVQGAEGYPLTPSSFDAKPHGHVGSLWLRPLSIDNAVVFHATGGRSVREFRLNQAEGIIPSDLSILARHLFEQAYILDWDYAGGNERVIWAVRTDGVLLGLTYAPEQGVSAWHRHDTDGDYEAVAVIPDGQQDEVWTVVERTINGVTRRYIERFDTDDWTEVEDAFYVDSGLSYDGRNTAANQIKATGGTTWLADEPMQLEADTAGTFVAGDVGKRFELTGDTAEGRHDGTDDAAVLTDSAQAWTVSQFVGGTLKNLTDGSEGVITANTATTVTATLAGGRGNDWDLGDEYEIVAPTVRMHVTAFTDGQNVDAYPVTDVPLGLQDAYTADWGRAVTAFAGLDHLEGEIVTALVDGNVHTGGLVQVSGGSVTLADYGVRVHIGLPYTSDLVTLPLEVPGGERLRRKMTTEVGLQVDRWRGLQAGESLRNLSDIQQREVERSYDGIIEPDAQLVVVSISHTWTRNAPLAIRQSEPLPVTVLSVIPEISRGSG